jgi:hypothetical protein
MERWLSMTLCMFHRARRLVPLDSYCSDGLVQTLLAEHLPVIKIDRCLGALVEFVVVVEVQTPSNPPAYPETSFAPICECASTTKRAGAAAYHSATRSRPTELSQPVNINVGVETCTKRSTTKDSPNLTHRYLSTASGHRLLTKH